MIARVDARPGRVIQPDVRCDLVWAAGRLVLVGPMTCAAEAPAEPGPRLIVSFDPFAASQWLTIPLGDLADRRVALADLLPPAAAEELLDSFAQGRLPAFSPAASGEDGPWSRLRQAAIALRCGGSVGAAAAQAGLSPRQLERQFQAQLGMTPKHFQKVLRLRRALASAKAGESLAGAAAVAGYADQPHLNRDVRRLTGLAPSQLLARVANVQDVIAGHETD